MVTPLATAKSVVPMTISLIVSAAPPLLVTVTVCE